MLIHNFHRNPRETYKLGKAPFTLVTLFYQRHDLNLISLLLESKIRSGNLTWCLVKVEGGYPRPFLSSSPSPLLRCFVHLHEYTLF